MIERAALTNAVDVPQYISHRFVLGSVYSGEFYHDFVSSDKAAERRCCSLSCQIHVVQTCTRVR